MPDTLVYCTGTITSVLTTDGDLIPVCDSAWQTIDISSISQSILPLTDLTVSETASLMAASATFLVVCYLGRILVRSAFSAGND